MSEDASSSQTPDRMRQHPEERFRGEHRKIDLNVATDALRAEARSGSGGGQRQTTLYKDGDVTIALFLFEPGGGLAQHKAAGTVSIHALDGRLRVTAGDETYQLTAGQLVVLAPDVPHDVTAGQEPTRMLLTVHLTPSTASASP
jgi:quercetin dioxygenase-like cupin family protein